LQESHAVKGITDKELPMISNRTIRWFLGLPDVVKFLGLISVTFLITYFAPSPMRVLWYIFLLVLYYFSANEALWLAFFLATSDGFAGFFGLYAVTMTVLPGLPAVELLQLYILLTVIKSTVSRVRPLVFYKKYLEILFLYLIFMIVWGQMMGLTGELNVYFRVAKGVLPMFLFFSIPRLFVHQDTYTRLFHLVFVIVLVAFAAQLFSLFTGIVPSEDIVTINGAGDNETDEFRVFFNSGSTLIGLFGAFYLLNIRKSSIANDLFLLTVVFIAFAMALLSATRGWILGFGFIIILTIAFTGVFKSRHFAIYAAIATMIVIWAFRIPTVKDQVDYAWARVGTLKAIAEGDLTAEGTLHRLDVRSKNVMEGWKQNPIFGWGLSDNGYLYGDGHVGNQCLLAMSGIIGFILLNGFLIYFMYKLFMLYFKSDWRLLGRRSTLVFIMFLVGWFFIHSTSGQQFNYIGMPVKIIPQAVFFSFGAFRYEQSMKLMYGKKIRKGSSSLPG